MIAEIPLRPRQYKSWLRFRDNVSVLKSARQAAARYSHSFPVEGSAISAPDFPTLDCATGR